MNIEAVNHFSVVVDCFFLAPDTCRFSQHQVLNNGDRVPVSMQPTRFLHGYYHLHVHLPELFLDAGTPIKFIQSHAPPQD